MSAVAGPNEAKESSPVAAHSQPTGSPSPPLTANRHAKKGHARARADDDRQGKPMIQGERVQNLNERDLSGAAPGAGEYVLYWMQRAQRARMNHALEYAVRKANHLGVPLLAVFGITERFPGANERSYRFMLEGLVETQQALRDRGVQLVVRLKPPVEAVIDLAGSAALIVVDRGYLRVERA